MVQARVTLLDRYQSFEVQPNRLLKDFSLTQSVTLAKPKLSHAEITPLAYCELRKAAPLLYEAENAFMQNEAADILPDGEGLYVCCRKADGYYFARLLPGSD